MQNNNNILVENMNHIKKSNIIGISGNSETMKELERGKILKQMPILYPAKTEADKILRDIFINKLNNKK